MGGKLPSNVLTYRDLQVFNKIENEGKTLDKTAEELGVSRDTIKRTKKKDCYRNLVLDALEKKGFTVETYVTKLVGLTDAEKEINIGGDIHFVPDQTTRMKAIDKVGKVYGDNCPTENIITSNFASSSDEELFEELEGRCKDAGVDEGTGERPEAESDTGTLDGTIL